jgi:uncharacterized protein
MSDYPGPGGTTADPSSMAWLVERFVNEVPGITHAVVLSLDGLQLAAAGAVDRDLADQLSALTAGLLSIAGQYGLHLRLGEAENLTIRFPHGHLAFMRIGQSAGLCVAARPGTDMRTLAFQMTRFVASVGHALTPQLRSRLHRMSITTEA